MLYTHPLQSPARPFAFPWGVLISVVALSVVCAFLAACLPAKRYTTMRITDLMRAN